MMRVLVIQALGGLAIYWVQAMCDVLSMHDVTDWVEQRKHSNLVGHHLNSH